MTHLAADNFACRMIKHMVQQAGDGDSPEEAFGVAWDDLKEVAPADYGANRVVQDLEQRGWVRVRRSKLHVLGNSSALDTDPVVAEILPAGREAAKTCMEAS